MGVDSVMVGVSVCPQARKEKDLGKVDLEEEATKRQWKFYIPNWFSVEIKTGVSGCPLLRHSTVTPPPSSLLLLHSPLFTDADH